MKTAYIKETEEYISAQEYRDELHLDKICCPECYEAPLYFIQKLNLKCKTTKNNVISSYKEDYFFDRKIREDRVLDDLDRLFQN